MPSLCGPFERRSYRARANVQTVIPFYRPARRCRHSPVECPAAAGGVAEFPPVETLKSAKARTSVAGPAAAPVPDMLATVHSATLTGIDSVPVEVQASFGKGLPDLEIVGL